MGIGERLQHAWNVFTNNKDPTYLWKDMYVEPTFRPDRPRLSGKNERSIVNAIINRMAVDAAQIDILHARLDDDGRYKETIDSALNSCLNLEANIDQAARAFRQDIYMSMMDEGHVAIVPVDTDVDLSKGSIEIYSMRTGKVVDWAPESVKVRLYNERTGKHEDVVVPKRKVAIVENPFYSVMNAPNSTLQRLIRKLNILDAIDEQSGSGKLDLIIQLPYVIKTPARKAQAEERRKDIEMQLSGSKFGIAYTDGTERITQLNRPVENNLMKQIEYLTNLLFSQLGFTQAIMDGTADEKTMVNYYTRTIDAMVSAVVEAMKRTFLTKTARSQKQTITYFRDPFKLVPVGELAEMSDKLTRNEIMSSNEIRQKIGLKPSTDPRADELVNKNLSAPNDSANGSKNVPEDIPQNKKEENQNGEL